MCRQPLLMLVDALALISLSGGVLPSRLNGLAQHRPPFCGGFINHFAFSINVQATSSGYSSVAMLSLLFLLLSKDLRIIKKACSTGMKL